MAIFICEHVRRKKRKFLIKSSPMWLSTWSRNPPQLAGEFFFLFLMNYNSQLKKKKNYFIGCTLKLLMSQYVSNAFEQGFSLYECFSEFLFTLQEKFQTLKSFTNLYLVFIGCLCGGMEKEWKTGTFIDNSWINVFYMAIWKSRRLSWKSI